MELLKLRCQAPKEPLRPKLQSGSSFCLHRRFCRTQTLLSEPELPAEQTL